MNQNDKVHGKAFCKSRCECYHDEGVTIFEEGKTYSYKYEFRNFKHHQHGDHIWVWNDENDGIRFMSVVLKRAHLLKLFSHYFEKADKRIMNKKLKKVKSA
jgi:hypothetical protein